MSWINFFFADGGDIPFTDADKERNKLRIEIDLYSYWKEALLSALLGAYAVLFFWEGWSKGVSALGLNATVFIFGIICLFAICRQRERPLKSDDLLWIMPSIVIGLSYSIYANTFFKNVNLLVFPLLFAWYLNSTNDVFTNRFLTQKTAVVDLVKRSLLATLPFILPAWNAYAKVLANRFNTSPSLIKRVSLGLLFFALASALTVPLLYTADTIFAERIDVIVTWPIENFSWSFVLRVVVGTVIALLLFSTSFGWSRPWSLSEDSPITGIDSVISGIALTGILAIYLLFIATRIEQIFVSVLPNEPDSVRLLVKTGFWQLVALSFINVGVFSYLYKKTNQYVQIILAIFAASSLIILGSAGHKMYLYVLNHGLSYEKFYASYAVLFCGVLLGRLLAASFFSRTCDVIRVGMLYFLVMYSALALLPVSQIIWHTNTALTNLSDSPDTWLLDEKWHDELTLDVTPRVTELLDRREAVKDEFYVELGRLTALSSSEGSYQDEREKYCYDPDTLWIYPNNNLYNSTCLHKWILRSYFHQLLNRLFPTDDHPRSFVTATHINPKSLNNNTIELFQWLVKREMTLKKKNWHEYNLSALIAENSFHQRRKRSRIDEKTY